MSDEGSTLEALSARLEKVERIQRTNLPKFRNVLKRLAAMEKSMASAITAISEIKALAKADAELRVANAEKLDSILGFMTHAKTWGGYARKYWPRLITFVAGVAVAKGWVTVENSHNFLQIFGL